MTAISGLTCFTETTWQLWHEQFLYFRGILRPDMISVVSPSICYFCKAFLKFVSLPLYDIRATGNDACGHPHGWETNISSIYTSSQHQSFKSALANFAMQWKQPKPLLLGSKTWKSSHIFKCCDIAEEKKTWQELWMFSSIILYFRSLFIARRRNRLKCPHAHKRSNVAVTKIPFFKL